MKEIISGISGKIIFKFSDPNVSALLQVFEQGVFEFIKRVFMTLILRYDYEINLQQYFLKNSSILKQLFRIW